MQRGLFGGNWSISFLLMTLGMLGSLLFEFRFFFCVCCLCCFLTVFYVFDFLLFQKSKCIELPTSFSLTLVIQYSMGIGLIFFTYWAKTDAHRVIGDYCWLLFSLSLFNNNKKRYWGDFFFRVQLKLTFDGIFSLFPHPMYTSGYAAYYAVALLSRSWTVFFCNSAAHLLQLAFLVLVEEPHIQRLYGTATTNEEEQLALPDDLKQHTPAVSPRPTGTPTSPTDMLPHHHRTRSAALLAAVDRIKKPTDSAVVFLTRIDPFRAYDFLLLLFFVYALVFSLSTSITSSIVHAAVWKLAQWGFVGGVLWHQGRSRFWTRRYEARGLTIAEAFDNWKLLYNFFLTINVATAVGVAWQLTNWADELWSMKWLAMQAGGVILIVVNAYSSSSAYRAIGDFGWYVFFACLLFSLLSGYVPFISSSFCLFIRFYGDFFVPPELSTKTLIYEGVYRYLNNPDAITGYTAFYGLACMSNVRFFFPFLPFPFPFPFPLLLPTPKSQQKCFSSPSSPKCSMSSSSSSSKIHT
jgi:phosphatidylethanolamine N-methyltransferase